MTADEEREIELSMHRCCFVFSRYELLNMKYPEADAKIDAAVRRAIDRGYTTFLCGMNRGADLWAAQIVLRMGAIYLDRGIKLVSVLPFPNYGDSFSPEWKKQYDFLLEWGYAQRTISRSNTGPETLDKRNRWMADRSTRLITIWHGEEGTAKNMVEYAKKKELDIDCIV